MVECEICEGKGKKVYEDGLTIVMLPEKPSVLGHVKIFTRQHISTLEEIPDEALTHLFSVANIVSAVLFELTKAEGTNIIVNNGKTANQETEHMCIDILPRKINDGLNFKWKPKQFTEEEMKDAMNNIKDKAFFIGKKKEEKKKTEELPKAKELKYARDIENYLLKQLRRIP